MSGGNNGKVLTVSRKLAKILKAITPLRPSNEGLGLCFLFSRFCCNYLHFYLSFFSFFVLQFMVVGPSGATGPSVV